jgi:beta-phosphoglucomutase-like phosphatase (HAD superfamily)
MAFRGLIFDLNGVLWWDSHLQEEAWQRLCVELWGRPLSEEEMSVYVHGRNNGETLNYLAGRCVRAEELEQLIRQKEEIYRRMCLDQGDAFRLSPGAVELLDFLAARRIPRTIATASGRSNVGFFVERLCLERWFNPDTIVYDDGTRPGKPAPDIYVQAACNLGLEPAECVVIEDSQAGIRAAHAAGIGYLIALGPAERHSRLTQLAGVSQAVEGLWQVPRERLFLEQPGSDRRETYGNPSP